MSETLPLLDPNLMSEDYAYDIFLSWRRAEATAEWVRRYFLPDLRSSLYGELPAEPRIFVDEESIPPGSPWPAHLRDALLRSRLLLALWEPGYFRSDWCMQELESFWSRSQHLDAPDQSLIVPLRISDGEHYQSWLGRIQCLDYTPYFYWAPAFAHSAARLTMQQQIRELARRLNQALAWVPPWRPDFPISSTAPLTPPPPLTPPRWKP